MPVHNPDLDELYDEYKALVVKRKCDVYCGPKPECPKNCPPNVDGFCACYNQMEFDNYKEMQDESNG